MLFSRQHIDSSLILFREQIKSAPQLPFKKLSTIDCLFSAIFFEKEIGSIKALANKQAVHGHFSIPKAKKVFADRGVDIPLEILKTIIFNCLAPLFNEIEPSSIGLKYYNENSGNFFWFQSDFYPQLNPDNPNNGYLGLMHTGSFMKMQGLVGYEEIYPTFDIDTATLYCDLFNNSMGIDLENLPKFGLLTGHFHTNENAYVSLCESVHMQNEFSISFISALMKKLIDEVTGLDFSHYTYEDFFEHAIDESDIEMFSYQIEAAMNDSLWEIKRQFFLLGDDSLSDGRTWESILNDMILILTIPKRLVHIENINLNSPAAEFIKAALISSFSEAQRGF